LFLCLAAIAITPIIIGLVFGSPFKMSLRQGLVLTDRTYPLFILRPMADELFALTAMMLAWTLVVRTCRRTRSG